MAKTDDMVVFITSGEAACSECGEELGRHAWIMLTEEKNALGLTCADLEHLVYLPSGDTALTRRSRKHSTLVAVVLKWSRARKRYERQGLLVEEAALEQAEQECLADTDARARQRERAAERRVEQDTQFVAAFAEKVRELFPHCPPGRESLIAEHACLKYSGRVGRSAAAKELNEHAVWLAVTAHVRHNETAYDKWLAKGYARGLARAEVEDDVRQVLRRWRGRE